MSEADDKIPKSDEQVEFERCPTCHGTGSAPLVPMSICATCLGRGRSPKPLEPVDTGAIPYLQALEGAEVRGFAPIGWLYTSVMIGLVEKGFARADGNNHFRLSALGRAELEKHRRNEARRPKKAAAP